MMFRRRHAAEAAALDRGMGALAPKRGWPGRGGGHATYLQPPPEWRGTTVQVCGLWPYGVGAGAPLGRGRGYINPLDMRLTRDALALLDSGAGTIGQQERAKLRRELVSDARGKRHAMVAALATIQRTRPLDDGEDTILAAALTELDE